MRRVLLLAALVASPLMAPAPASASKSQESVFQDDRMLISLGDQVRQQTIAELDALGVDTIHSLVFWHKLAPRRTSRRRPHGFHPSDPADYAAKDWDPYDGLVRDAAARGISLILSPNGLIPAWASDCPAGSPLPYACRPNVTQFKAFVKAIGIRYSGIYRDENQGRGLLPPVNRWSIFNEPNQAGWLYPQRVVKNGVSVPEAPRIYRKLFYAGVQALRVSGHKNDQFLLGETAPVGRRFGSPGKLSMGPAAFYREVFCLDRRGKPFKGVEAKLRGCQGKFKRLRATGVTHHPYSRGAGPPLKVTATRDDVPIDQLPRLVKVLNQAAKAKRFPKRAPIYLTEFGYETIPPGRKFGVRPVKQAVLLNEAEWIAFQNRRVASFGWYELWDERDPNVFNTGLKFFGGREKPAFDAYRLPIWVAKRKRKLVVFGGLRPADPAIGQEVRIQNRAPGQRRFKTVKKLTVGNEQGYFRTKVPRRAGRWRLWWRPFPGEHALVSRVASPARR
jgi:hypothetical protein